MTSKNIFYNEVNDDDDDESIEFSKKMHVQNVSSSDDELDTTPRDVEPVSSAEKVTILLIA